MSPSITRPPLGPTLPSTRPLPPAPIISGYTDLGGAGITAAVVGTSIKIVGANFGTGGAVTFNGINATPTAWSDTAITVPVPGGARLPKYGAGARHRQQSDRHRP